MTIADVVKVTPKGVFIPRAAYENFGEIEVVRTSESIVIQPKSQSPDQIVELLQQTGLLLTHKQTPPSGRAISPKERTELAQKFGAGRPLSESIVEEREERW